MERPTARKLGKKCENHQESNDVNVIRSKRRKTTLQRVIVKLMLSPSFYWKLLIAVNALFVSSLLISSLNTTASLRARSRELVTFSSLRSPSRIQSGNTVDILVKAGYLMERPHVVGAYFSGPKSESFIGAEVLPTSLQRRLTTHAIDLPMSKELKQMQLEHSKSYEDGAADVFESGACKAPYDWMKSSFPTCNTLHERDLTRWFDSFSPSQKFDQVKMLGAGYWRDVWRVKNEMMEETVLKTMRFEHDYTARNYDRHRRDALAMDRLTWSPNILDIYAFCGNSGIFEYAAGGDIESMIDFEKQKVDWNSTERLVAAYQVAAAITDAHDTERNGMVTLAHTDITPSQFVHVNKDWSYKLNDFNRCRFIARDGKTGEPCGFEIGNNPGTFRSPEEYYYYEEDEKVDIYSMGNVFYVILTALWPFDDIKSKAAQKLIKEGQRPPVDKKLIESTDPAIQTLYKGMRACWHQSSLKRPTAKDVRDYFRKELTKLGYSDETLS